MSASEWYSFYMRNGRIQYLIRAVSSLIEAERYELVSASDWYLCACGVAAYNTNESCV